MILKQNRKTFPKKLDFVTSPGFINKQNPRLKYNMPGQGPSVVITDYGVFGFSDQTHEMILRELHPGVTLEDLRQNIAWPVSTTDQIVETQAPSPEELRILREELDPGKVYLKS
jgi:glutaconate CoA-transferase subunit B